VFFGWREANRLQLSTPEGFVILGGSKVSNVKVAARCTSRRGPRHQQQLGSLDCVVSADSQAQVFGVTAEGDYNGCNTADAIGNAGGY
jgi:hypothetical protein